MPSERKHYWLYVLLLQGNKYYIGKTSKKNPDDRVKEHINGFYSAQWTKKHKPIRCMEKIDIGFMTDKESDQYELKRTRQYMKKYGYQNVRGGILNYSGKYVKIGDRFFRGDQFFIMIAIIYLLSVILLLFLKAR